MRIVCPFAPVSLTANTARTLVQAVAGTGGFKLSELGVSFEGVATDAKPILVKLVVQTTAGTATALTPVRAQKTDGNAIRTTAQHIFTAEPTSTDVLRSWYVHPQTGLMYPFDISVLASAEFAAATKIGILALSAAGEATVNATGHLEVEE